MIQYSYYKFCQEIKDILATCGDSGFVMYTEKRAFISFDKTPDLTVYIIGEKVFEKSDFKELGSKFEFIGKSSVEVEGLFRNDLRYNWIKIMVMSVFFILIFNPLTLNKDALMGLIDKLIDILSIFSGMVFVFIGFFYGDKERTIEVYKKGRCDEEFLTDRYILMLSFSSIIMLIAANLLGNVSFYKLANKLLCDNVCRIIYQYNIKWHGCVLLVYLSIVNIIICFDSLINYYLKTMRNKYFIDAVKEKIKERKAK